MGIEKENIARIIKLESFIVNGTVYIIEGALMKRLMENVFVTRQPIFAAIPFTTREFIREFKEKFMQLDEIANPITSSNSDMKMLEEIMINQKYNTVQKIEYLDKVISKSVFPELVEAAQKLKGGLFYEDSK